MNASSPARPKPMRALCGIVLLTIGLAVLSLAAVSATRTPYLCGRESYDCGGSLLSLLVIGILAVSFAVMPGVRRLPKVAGLVPAVALLFTGGLTAAIYATRFVADPITESTTGTWIGVGVFGTLAVLSLVALLLSGVDVSESPETEAAARTELVGRATAPPAAASRAATSYGSGIWSGSAAGRIDPQIVALRALLLHGLASGRLATVGQAGSIAADRAPDVETLLDLHRRGVLDDDALRDAIAALRAN